MKRVLKTNGTIHSCEVCIHNSYCKQDKDTILNKRDSHSFNGFIHIPDNCPILIPNKLVKVVFT